MDNSRTAAFWMFIGTNGTGKSTQMRKAFKMNARNLIIPANKVDKAFDNIPELRSKQMEVKIGNQKPKEINVYPTLNTFKGNRKAFLYDNDDIFGVFERFDKDPRRCFVKGGVFMDDCKNYIRTRGPLPSNVRSIFSDRRHLELDIFMAFHSWQYVNPEFFSYNPTCFVFRVTQPITNELKGKIGNFEELEKVQARVNHIAETSNPYYFEQFNPI